MPRCCQRCCRELGVFPSPLWGGARGGGSAIHAPVLPHAPLSCPGRVQRARLRERNEIRDPAQESAQRHIAPATAHRVAPRSRLSLAYAARPGHEIARASPPNSLPHRPHPARAAGTQPPQLQRQLRRWLPLAENAPGAVGLLLLDPLRRIAVAENVPLALRHRPSAGHARRDARRRPGADRRQNFMHAGPGPRRAAGAALIDVATAPAPASAGFALARAPQRQVGVGGGEPLRDVALLGRGQRRRDARAGLGLGLDQLGVAHPAHIVHSHRHSPPRSRGAFCARVVSL